MLASACLGPLTNPRRQVYSQVEGLRTCPPSAESRKERKKIGTDKCLKHDEWRAAFTRRTEAKSARVVPSDEDGRLCSASSPCCTLAVPLVRAIPYRIQTLRHLRALWPVNHASPLSHEHSASINAPFWNRVQYPLSVFSVAFAESRSEIRLESAECSS